MPATPLQPVVIWFGRVGDMILLTALLEILHRRYGRACHVIGAGSWPAQIYAAHSDVARVSALHRYTAWLFDRAFWRLVRLLRASPQNPVYVCEMDRRKLARIERVLRFAGIARERCLFITEQPGITATHWVDRLVAFAKLTPPAFDARDYPWPSPPPPCAPHLEVAPAARAKCDAWIDARGWRGRALILVQPGNRRTMRGKRLELSAEDDKVWPTARWAELLHRIHAHMPEAVIILCGAPRETLLLGWIADATRLAAVASAELPLPELFALCASAHSMISVDTGPAHAAAALGLPLVVLFGANTQAEWLPRSPSGSAVIGLGGPPSSHRLDEISVDRVFDAWCSLPLVESSPPAPVKAQAARASPP
ncbi:MAG TPA: glycosyltransferase family 9 protein [Steroidobacteraceae bacterium]|nr:glycosyltransferase family 9 protein [Steroidobacteraceae bacterium]